MKNFESRVQRGQCFDLRERKLEEGRENYMTRRFFAKMSLY
jgi:hypothetical protein